MSAVGVVRAVLTWAVGGYLLAGAAFGPVLALYLVTGGRTGLAVAALSGPVALLVLTPFAATRLLAAAADAGAEPDPGATRSAGGPVAPRSADRPVVWSAPGLHGSATVALRGLRRARLVRPVGTDIVGTDTGARRLAHGTALVLPLCIATAAALERWWAGARFCASPWTDRRMNWSVRLRLLLLPLLTPIALAGAALAWVATLLMTLLTGPAAVRDAVAAAGTADGALARAARRFHASTVWMRGRTPVGELGDDVVEDTGRGPVLDGRPVGLLRLPAALAASQAPFGVVAAVAVDVVLGVLLWQPARLVVGTDAPTAALVTTVVLLLPVLVVTVTLTRRLTGHAALVAAEDAALGPVAPGDAAGRRPGPRDVLGLWPFWIGVVLVSGVAALGVSYAVGLAGRLVGRTDHYRDVAGAVAFPVILVALVVWTLHAVLRRGDPLGLVRRSRRSRGLDPD